MRCEQISRILIIAGLALSGIFCDESSKPQPTERWVYYAIPSADGASNARTGLFRYGINSRRYERVAPLSVAKTTAVAVNGVLMFLNNPEGGDALYGRCENGSVVPVPFPVHPDPRFEYALDSDVGRGLPSFNVAYGGHYAAYAVVLKPKSSSARDSSWHQVLVRVNCAQGTLTLFDLDDSLRGADANACDGILLFDGIGISSDGSRICFGVDRMHGATLVDHRLMLWDAGTLRTMHASTGLLPYSVRGIIGIHEAFIVQGLSNMLFRMSADAPAPTEIPGMYGAMRTPGQSAAASILLVTAGTDGIELRSPVDGSEIEPRIPYSSFVPEAMRAHVDTYRLSVSADGTWIGCTVQLDKGWPDPLSTCRVFVMRADGSDVRFIAQASAVDAPAIAGEGKP